MQNHYDSVKLNTTFASSCVRSVMLFGVIMVLAAKSMGKGKAEGFGLAILAQVGELSVPADPCRSLGR